MAAERTARSTGTPCWSGNLAEGGEDGAAVVQMLIDRRVDGVIAAAPQLEGDTEVADMLRRYVPAVSLHHVPGGGVPLVGSNHRAGARTADRAPDRARPHLDRDRHRPVPAPRGAQQAARLRGRAARGAGIEPDEDLAVEADWTPGTAATATRLLLERGPRMTAIFVHSDTMAIGVLSALASAGRRVPADVAVVELRRHALRRVPDAVAVRRCGCRSPRPAGQAVELLLRSIAGEPAPQSTVRLPVELIVRDSCGGRAATRRRSAPSPRPGASPAHREKQKEDS